MGQIGSTLTASTGLTFGDGDLVLSSWLSTPFQKFANVSKHGLLTGCPVGPALIGAATMRKRNPWNMRPNF
jgi:hypothetical protein